MLKRDSMRVQLVQALEDREQLRAHMANLAGLPEDSDVSAEQADALKAEYEKRLLAAEQQIDLFRNKCRNEISILKTTVDAYNAQIEKLRVQAASGALTAQQFQQQAGKLTRGKGQTEEKLAAFQTMLAAESPADLGAMATPRAARIPFAGADMRNVALRLVGGVFGALFLVATFMPAVQAMGGVVKVSLFQAGNLIHSLGESRGLLLWIVPITLGLVVGLTSFVSKRSKRGGILLFTGTLVLSPLVISLAAATFYPTAISTGMTELVNTVASPGTGIFLLFAALLGTYILAGINLWPSGSGKGWSILSVLLLVVAAVGTSGYCLFGVNAVPQLTLALADRNAYGTTVNITVSNSGNLPMVLGREVSDKAKRNEFALKIQSRQANSAWSDVTVRADGQLFDVGANTVLPGESKVIEYPAGFAGRNRADVIRGVLVNNRGDVATSPPLEIVQPSQPGLVSSPDPVAVQDIDRDAAMAKREIAMLEAQGGSILLENLAQSVAVPRSAVNRIKAEPMRDELHIRIDRVILSAKDTQTRQMFDEATKLVESDLYDRAVETCERIVGLCLRPPELVVLEQEPRVLGQTRALLVSIDLLVNPTKRYEVRGIIAQGTSTSAMVYDNHTKMSYTVSVNDKLDDYTVERLDDKQGVLVLRKGRDTFMLSRQ